MSQRQQECAQGQGTEWSLRKRGDPFRPLQAGFKSILPWLHQHDLLKGGCTKEVTQKDVDRLYSERQYRLLHLPFPICAKRKAVFRRQSEALTGTTICSPFCKLLIANFLIVLHGLCEMVSASALTDKSRSSSG